MSAAIIIIYFFYGYLLLGVVFSVWFVTRGVEKVDEGMHQAKWTIRFLLLPGSVALWPLLLIKYLNVRKQLYRKV